MTEKRFSKDDLKHFVSLMQLERRKLLRMIDKETECVIYRYKGRKLYINPFTLGIRTSLKRGCLKYSFCINSLVKKTLHTATSLYFYDKT